MDVTALGPLVSSHQTDNARRGTAVLVLFVVAAVGLGVGIPWSIGTLTRPYGPGESPSTRPAALPAAFISIGVLAVLVAVPKLIKWLRARTDSLELHQHGLRRNGEPIPWTAVASARKQGFETGGLRHYLGFDFRCVVELTDGRRFVFTSYTKDATQLADAIAATTG
ncbi:hypothetical protein ABZU76_29760 [Amycolatopsis sp. NPDC005232]|uniref:hypothetical protein n=1 Tax=Amycolatopsis sp. NPDC005232 TaxID=3157027 RepID=UPI0033A434ED